MSPLGIYGAIVINPVDGSSLRPDPTINLKIAGERVITPTSIVGAQTGDDFTAQWGAGVLPSWNIWFSGGYAPYIPDITSEDPSVWPSVTVEIITDQGFGTVPTSQL
jgi:hypothetical protein